MKKCFLVDIIVFRGIHGEDVLFIMKINFKMTTLRRLKEKHISLLKSTFSKAVLSSFVFNYYKFAKDAHFNKNIHKNTSLRTLLNGWSSK